MTTAARPSAGGRPIATARTTHDSAAAAQGATTSDPRTQVKHFVDTNILLHNPDAIFVFRNTTW